MFRSHVKYGRLNWKQILTLQPAAPASSITVCYIHVYVCAIWSEHYSVYSNQDIHTSTLPVCVSGHNYLPYIYWMGFTLLKTSEWSSTITPESIPMMEVHRSELTASHRPDREKDLGQRILMLILLDDIWMLYVCFNVNRCTDQRMSRSYVNPFVLLCR